MSIHPSTLHRFSPSHTVEKEQNGDGSILPPDESFAATTYLGMGKQDAKRLNDLREKCTAKKVTSWAGRVRGLPSGYEGCKISMRSARRINQNAETPIFEIDESHLIQFKVIDFARKTLQRLSGTHCLMRTAKALGLHPTFLHHIKDGHTRRISKENADKIGEHFATDVFGIHQIFERARTENLGLVRKQENDNPALFTYIQYDEQIREKVKNLDFATKVKIGKIIGRETIYRDNVSTSVRNAVVINKISGSEIFSFSVQKLVKVPYSMETCTQLNKLIEKKIAKDISVAEMATSLGLSSYHSLHWIKKRKYQKIEFATAKQINTYFKKPLFNFENLLNEAVTAANDFYETSLQRIEEIPASKTRKRNETEETDYTPSPVHASSDSASDSSFDDNEGMMTPTADSQLSLSTTETFADSTYLKIDELAAGRLDQLKADTTSATIFSWLNGRRNYLDRKSDKISIREARLINENSKLSIFEISEDHLLQVKVVNSARETLKTLKGKHRFKEISKGLGLYGVFLQKIKDGTKKSITIQDAKKIDEFFQADVFRIHEIFHRACNENINEVQTINESSEFTIIEYDAQRKKEVNELDPAIKAKLLKTIGSMIYRYFDSLSIRNAVAINQISGSNIFSFSVEKLVAVPISEETRNRIIELLEIKVDEEGQTIAQITQALQTDHNILQGIKIGIQKRIQVVTADKMNTYFGEPLFDFEKILNDAKQDALRFYEASQIDLPSAEKRKTPDTEVEAQPSKMQKTDPLEEQQPPIDLDSADYFSDFLPNEDDFWRSGSLADALSPHPISSSHSTTSSEPGSPDPGYYAAASPSIPTADIDPLFF